MISRSVTATSTKESSPTTINYYGYFTSGATIKDIYLAVGDKVQLYFYNSESSGKYWSARVNSGTWLTSVSATAGSYATYTRSIPNTTANCQFNLTVTATTASGDSYDQLTVQDYAGNVYHYRVHVVAAREVYAGESITISANSFASKAWTISNNTSTSTASAEIAPTTATDAATVTVTGLDGGSTTLTVQNYESETTTGALGAIYTFTLTVHDKLTLEYTASDVVVPYDGLGHSVAVSCTTPNSVIRFSTSTNGPWSSTPPVITNATTGTKVYYQISAGDAYKPVSGVVVLEVTALKVTVTAGDAEIWEYDPLPTLTAKVSGVLAGESTNLITYVLSAPDQTAGTHSIVASGSASQGNYTVSYVNGTLNVKSWAYPAGPNSEIIPIDRDWVKTMGKFDDSLRYAAASNFFYATGANGVINWMNYVLGLDPTDVKSGIYLDLEPNLSAVTQPTLVVRGAKVRPMSIGSLTNVSFRLLKSTSPTGTYEKVGDALDGRFPQQNMPIEYFRIDTRFLFESK